MKVFARQRNLSKPLNLSHSGSAVFLQVKILLTE